MNIQIVEYKKGVGRYELYVINNIPDWQRVFTFSYRGANTGIAYYVPAKDFSIEITTKLIEDEES